MGLWPFGRTKADVETTSRVVVLRARDAVALRAKVTVKFEEPQTQAVAEQVLEICQDIMRAVVREAPLAAAVLGFDAALAAEVMGRIPPEPAAVRSVEIAGLHIVGDPGHLAQPVAGPESNPAWLHAAASPPSSSERPPAGGDRLTPVQAFPAAKPISPTPVQPMPAIKKLGPERSPERSTPVHAPPGAKPIGADRSPERLTPVEANVAKGRGDPFAATAQSPQPDAWPAAAPVPNVPIAAAPANAPPHVPGASQAPAPAAAQPHAAPQPHAAAQPHAATQPHAGPEPHTQAATTQRTAEAQAAPANGSPGAPANTPPQATPLAPQVAPLAAPATGDAAHAPQQTAHAPQQTAHAPQQTAHAPQPTAQAPQHAAQAPQNAEQAPHPAPAAAGAAAQAAPATMPAPAPPPNAAPAAGPQPHIAHAPTIPAIPMQQGPAPKAHSPRVHSPVEIARDPGPTASPAARAGGALPGLPPGQRPGRVPIAQPPLPRQDPVAPRDAASAEKARREHRTIPDRPAVANHPGAYSGVLPADSTPSPGAVRARDAFGTTAGRADGAALRGRAASARSPSAPPPYLTPPTGRAFGPKRTSSSGSMAAVSPDDAAHQRSSVIGPPPPGTGLRPADEPSSSRSFGPLGPPSTGRVSVTGDEPSASSRNFGLYGPPSGGPRSSRSSNRPPPAAVAARRRVVAARLPLPTGAGPYEVARGLTPLFRDTAGRILVAFLRTYDLTVIRRVPFDAVEGDILSSLTAPVEGAPGSYTASHASEIHRWREAFGTTKLDLLQREANLAAAALAHEMFTAEAVPSSMTAAVVEGLAGSAFGDPDMLLDLGRYLFPAHETTAAEALATMIEVAGEDMPPGLESALDPLFASLREEVAAAAELAKEVMLTPG